MSDPARWKVEELNCCFDADMIQSSTGDYVLWEDYARLKAENERLRRAGDVVLLALWLGVDDYSKTEKEKAEDAWNAAKDGIPTK
jgi:hypothetical protein